MRLITIQHKEVLKTLLGKLTYYAERTKREMLQRPYRTMIKHYGWNGIKAPVFGCVVGEPCEFMGCSTKDAYILTLEVPDEKVRLQAYYKWTETCYFLSHSDEWHQDYELPDYMEMVLNGLGLTNKYMAVQATFPYIRPEWLKAYEPYTDSFQKYINSGGKNVLEDWSKINRMEKS